jgi:hypothetical protein
MKENINYTLADLLEDDSFISSVNHPTAESDSHWATLRREGRVKEADYELARYCVRSFRLSGRTLTKEETATLWANIRMAAARRRSDSRRRLFLRLSLAACVLALTGLFVFHSFVPTDAAKPVAAVAPHRIEDVARPDSTGNDIQIVFSSEERMTLKEKTAEIKYNGKGETEVNSHVVSQPGKPEAQATAYNQVIVPAGRQ